MKQKGVSIEKLALDLNLSEEEAKQCCNNLFEADIDVLILLADYLDISVDYRSAGKYWIDVLEPFSEDNWIDIGRIKATKAKDEAKKKELVEALENVGEESNPIVLIATLK